MKTSITVFIAAMVFSGIALPASVNAQLTDCRYLQLLMPTNYHIVSVKCLQGIADSRGPNWVNFEQDGLHGPECQVHVESVYWYQFFSKFTVKQKYCLFKAGGITVTHQEGHRPIYTITEGKFNNSPGRIEVTAFEP